MYRVKKVNILLILHLKTEWMNQHGMKHELEDNLAQDMLANGMKAAKAIKETLIELKNTFVSEQKKSEQIGMNAKKIMEILEYFITDLDLWKKTIVFAVKLVEEEWLCRLLTP